MSNRDSRRIRASVCPLDCPDTCSLAVETDGADGQRAPRSRHSHGHRGRRLLQRSLLRRRAPRVAGREARVDGLTPTCR